jgi:hypothetical protein
MGGRAMKITAVIFLALMTIAGSAHALTVSKNVGPLLQEAQAMIVRQNYKAAVAKLDQAEAVRSNPDDEIVIAQKRQFIAVKSSHPVQP